MGGMRAVPLLLLVAGMALADPVKAYRSEVKALKSAERKFWREFQDEFMHAYNGWNAPFRQSTVDPEAVHDVKPMREFFARYRSLQEKRGEADLALAKSGHEKAHEILLKEWLAVFKRIDKAEEELADANPVLDRYVFDQRPAVQRQGLAVRARALVRALSGWDQLETKAWERAVRGDRKHTFARRVSVIDALALRADAKAAAFIASHLLSRDRALRIAAIEALVAREDKATHDALAGLLADQDPIVRRALLQEIARRAAAVPAWIAPVLKAFRAARGQERAEALAALAALTNQKFGHDDAAWQEWFDDYRKEIEGGRFDKTKIEVREAKPAPPKGEYVFYGVPTTSLGVMFVVEGSSVMLTPAAWETRRKKDSYTWWGQHRKWKDEFASHKSIFERELNRALEKLPSQAGWGLILLHGKFVVDATPKLLGLASRDVSMVRKKVERMPCSGWCSPLRGLVAAGELDPRVDTIFLVSTGELRGGRHLTPEAVLEAFARYNRFRRLVVHALRIDEEKEPGETLMRGLARASGGKYRWLEKPPD